MPLLFIRLIVLFFIGIFQSGYSSDFTSPQVSVAIEHTEIPEKSGDFYVVVTFSPQKGWHLYWQNPGDSGMPPKVEFELPAFAKASFLGFPSPKLYRKNGITSFIYDEPFSLIYQISTTETLDPKDIKLDLNWLVCKDSCIPQTHTTPLVNKTLIYLKDAQKKADMLPQEIFQGEIYEKNKKLYFVMPAETPESIESAHFFPKEQNFIVNDHIQKKKNYKKNIQLEVDLLTSKSKIEGFFVIKTKDTTKTYILDNDLGSEPLDTAYDSIWILLLSAFLGGLILNLMPCVFPVLSLKILHIMDHVETKKGLIRHGLCYTLGILLTFLLLFAAISIFKSAGHSIGWGFQLQSPYILLLLVVIFTVLSLNLLGVFEFSSFDTAHQTLHADYTKAHTSFLNGILVTIVATPCTAPFMGTALAVALSQSYVESLIVFFGLSVGLALPFLAFCFYPSGLRFLPKPGSWMKTFKEFLAFPMLGAIVWLLWVLENLKPTCLLPTVCMIFSTSFILWLYGKWQFTTHLISTRIIPLITFFTLLMYERESVIVEKIFYGIILVLVCVYAYTFLNILKRHAFKDIFKRIVEVAIACVLSFSFIPLMKCFDDTKEVIQAIPYSDELVKKTLKNGRPVFINYTARWCITCQMNKLNVLSSSRIKDALKSKNVLYLEADWTNHNLEISKSLKDYNRESIPLYVLKVPGIKKPIILPELLTEKTVLEALSGIK
ncbi:MAG: Thiol:disulfide interchange protein DsbD [Holosporales bacterium]